MFRKKSEQEFIVHLFKSLRVFKAQSFLLPFFGNELYSSFNFISLTLLLVGILNVNCRLRVYIYFTTFS